MATSQDFVNWVCGPDLDPHFLALLFIASRAHIRSLASGAVHKTVHVPTVKAFRVCVPNVSEQRRIAAILREQMASLEQARAAADAQLELIAQLTEAYLHTSLSEVGLGISDSANA
jgi:type I restriction enzyme S subunit